MSDTSDTGTRDTGAETAETADTGDTGDTGAETSEGTVEAGGAEEVILVVDGREIDVTDRPDDAFPPGSTVPDQQQSTAPDDVDRPTFTAHTRDVRDAAAVSAVSRRRRR